MLEQQDMSTFIQNPLTETEILFEYSDIIIEPFSKNIKRAVCEHQRLLVEFVFETIDFVGKIQKIKDENKLRNAVKKLFSTYFYNKRIEACDLSRQFLYEHFELDRKHVPRITVKGLRKSDKHIFDYYRSSGKPYDADCYSFHFEDNVAFKTVSEDKVAYHCDDIPLQAKLGHYYNSRLLQDRVARYNPIEMRINGQSLTYDDLISTCRDSEWEQCWINYPGSARHVSPLSCYKSTLVVPIALSHINMSLKEKLDISSDFNSAIFGYLCFDDVCTHYFNVPVDKYVGYIFSDILSHYLLIMNYVEYSVLSNQINRLGRKIWN